MNDKIYAGFLQKCASEGLSYTQASALFKRAFLEGAGDAISGAWNSAKGHIGKAWEAATPYHEAIKGGAVGAAGGALAGGLLSSDGNRLQGAALGGLGGGLGGAALAHYGLNAPKNTTQPLDMIKSKGNAWSDMPGRLFDKSPLGNQSGLEGIKNEIRNTQSFSPATRNDLLQRYREALLNYNKLEIPNIPLPGSNNATNDEIGKMVFPGAELS